MDVLVWSGEHTEPTNTPTSLFPRLGACPWMSACLNCSRDPSQARGHPQSAGLALVAWIPALSDFLDFGISSPSWTYPAFSFFSDLGLGLLTHITVVTTPSTLGNSEPWTQLSFRFRTLTTVISNSSHSSTCLCLSPNHSFGPSLP